MTVKAPSLSLFRTLWGLVKQDAGWKSVPDALELIARSGCVGVECSVQLAHRLPNFSALLEANRLDWAPVVFTSGPIDGCDPFCDGDRKAGPGSDWRTQLVAWEDQMIAIGRLGVCPSRIAFVNSFTGNDSMARDDALRLFEAMQLSFERGPGSVGGSVKLVHETHRGRVLYSPWTTRDIVRVLPEIALTADFSHWTVVTELNPIEYVECTSINSMTRHMLDEVITEITPNVHHVQGRIGFEQSAQVSDPRLQCYQSQVAGFERWWGAIFKHQLQRPTATDSLFTFTPEHGPPPYQVPIAGLCGDALLQHVDDINIWVGARAAKQFKQIAAANQLNQKSPPL